MPDTQQSCPGSQSIHTPIVKPLIMLQPLFFGFQCARFGLQFRPMHRLSSCVWLTGLVITVAVLTRMQQPARHAPPPLPRIFSDVIPRDCQQIMLVLAAEAHSPHAQVWLLERDLSPQWRTHLGPLPARLGHKGLAWGSGEHSGRVPPPAGFRIKKEGDLCSPAGVFRIPFAFGLASANEAAAWLRLPYTPLTQSIIGVDDPKSRYYNQIVDSTQVQRDWDSNEAMIRHDKLYEWGAFIAHNPTHNPGDGSCIFLHLWPGNGRPTAGCTALSASHLRAILAWLDPARHPLVVQGLESW